jgi:hypothetical protein
MGGLQMNSKWKKLAAAGASRPSSLRVVGGWAGIGLAAGLTNPTAGLGAVGGYAALRNYTSLGGQLTVLSSLR